MDNITKKTGAFAYDVGGWKIGTIWAFSGLGGILAVWANGLMMVFDVIFTTIAQNATNLAATPTGVGYKKVKKARERCVFYIIWHDSLDFTMIFIYNKA